MAVSRTISLPDDILRKAEELAARERISVEELILAALSEQFARAEYLRRPAIALAPSDSERLSTRSLIQSLSLTTACIKPRVTDFAL